MNKIRSSYSPEERRRLVDCGVKAGKSNRSIAREMDIDEGTVRRDRKYLATPEHERSVRKERPRKIKAPVPMYTLGDAASLIRQQRRVLKVLKQWITEQRMVLKEIEYVLDEAGKQLFRGREFVKSFPIPTRKPEELLALVRPDSSKWADREAPDYWAEWLARWLAVCLPAQQELHEEIQRETSLWARDRAAGPYTDGTCLKPVTSVARATWIYSFWL